MAKAIPIDRIFIGVDSPSEREARLQFQPAVVGALRENAIAGAGGLVGLAEERRRDVADDRSRIVVIRDVADLHGDGKAVTTARRTAGAALTSSAH